MYYLLFASFIAIGVFAIIAIIKFVQKNSATGKKMLIYTGVSIALFFVSFIGLGITAPESETAEGDTTPVTKVVAKETAAEKADREAKEAEEKLAAEEKAKEEAKEKAKAEKKAKAEAKKKALAEKEAKKKAEAKRKQTAITNSKKITFPMLNKAADRYAGKPYYLKGEVVQAMEDGNFTVMRINITQDSWGWTDTVWVEFADVTDAVDGDIVEVYGEIFGKHTYDTAIGGSMTLPGIIAEQVKVLK
ncbi:hypothetical protein ACFVP8_00135 [Viridibacillus arvi]|uniref:hypothetical protein n=1 Tax=Viridibacillus arvi TaxID=263475 RepID=UPI0036951702